MNLSHFLNESFEEQVIEKLHDIHKDSIKYYLTLWYEDGALNPTDVKNFIEKYESRLHFKTNIVVGNNLKSNDFIWFDITDRSNVSDNNRLRFQYIYNNRKDILKGLNEYHSCAKFCTSEKPPKRQKRNDYESSDSRK
jgi:hypothetical protein|tara:strand:+ start:50 stop:463 length:414 start_codon:yes stop_codon:yes gene_type:complete